MAPILSNLKIKILTVDSPRILKVTNKAVEDGSTSSFFSVIRKLNQFFFFSGGFQRCYLQDQVYFNKDLHYDVNFRTFLVRIFFQVLEFLNKTKALLELILCMMLHSNAISELVLGFQCLNKVFTRSCFFLSLSNFISFKQMKLITSLLV